VTENEKLEPSSNKPLEMDLTEISLDFEANTQLAPFDLAADPIPDAFNSDFSNMLKMKVEPQPVKSSLQATTSKVVTKKSKMSNDESPDIATKLELASAYIDMQDKEGALELLAEAIREGGPDQRKRAQALIDNLS
jgi:pilus assembly protein FimV